MPAGPIELKKGEILFREGDTSDSAYVIKSGSVAVTKTKGASEIVLAELRPGSMLGEMAFFDNKPRSAGAKAASDCIVISLPFTALYSQFKTFPEWLKVMVKTINNHLREANQRIKNLENANKDEELVFDPYTINRLTAILTMVATSFGSKEDDGVIIPTGTLRRYTIQIFQQPTNKMLKLTEQLHNLGHLILEDLGEGRQKMVIKNLDLLRDFVDYYNGYLFTEESKRITVREEDIPVLKALSFYAHRALEKGGEKNDDGTITISLSVVQNDSMRDLGELIRIEQIDPLVEKDLCSDKIMGEEEVSTNVDIEKIEPLIEYWNIIYTLLKVR